MKSLKKTKKKTNQKKFKNNECLDCIVLFLQHKADVKESVLTIVLRDEAHPKGTTSACGTWITPLMIYFNCISYISSYSQKTDMSIEGGEANLANYKQFPAMHSFNKLPEKWPNQHQHYRKSRRATIFKYFIPIQVAEG